MPHSTIHRPSGPPAPMASCASPLWLGPGHPETWRPMPSALHVKGESGRQSMEEASSGPIWGRATAPPCKDKLLWKPSPAGDRNGSTSLHRVVCGPVKRRRHRQCATGSPEGRGSTEQGSICARLAPSLGTLSHAPRGAPAPSSPSMQGFALAPAAPADSEAPSLPCQGPGPACAWGRGHSHSLAWSTEQGQAARAQGGPGAWGFRDAPGPAWGQLAREGGRLRAAAACPPGQVSGACSRPPCGNTCGDDSSVQRAGRWEAMASRSVVLRVIPRFPAATVAPLRAPASSPVQVRTRPRGRRTRRGSKQPRRSAKPVHGEARRPPAVLSVSPPPPAPRTHAACGRRASPRLWGRGTCSLRVLTAPRAPGAGRLPTDCGLRAENFRARVLVSGAPRDPSPGPPQSGGLSARGQTRGRGLRASSDPRTFRAHSRAHTATRPHSRAFTLTHTPHPPAPTSLPPVSPPATLTLTHSLTRHPTALAHTHSTQPPPPSLTLTLTRRQQRLLSLPAVGFPLIPSNFPVYFLSLGKGISESFWGFSLRS